MTKQVFLKQEITKGEEYIAAIKKAYNDLWQIELMTNSYKIALKFEEAVSNGEV
jgi:hypothetical protein